MRTDWAGSSMTVPPISRPYEQSAGAFADMIRSSDPEAVAADSAKAAAIVVGLAGREDAPTQILLGRDALQYWQAASWAVAESDEEWRPVSESTWA
ncbi:hypothetical protein [Streptomyces sp. NPDC090994]|uniref:hypothetical protein n=1 Tax=Streptomyces sp. NPDC090994 TaxID=3365969 RepID=UPI003806A8C8